MPGIVGFTRASSSPVDAASVLRGMQDLITRGSCYSRDELFCDEAVCATRSHINVLQLGTQPYRADGVLVWLDGEFLNRQELGREEGLTARSDSELLVRLYLKSEGLTFLRRINGIFSAVIYDTRKKSVHLVSDVFGFRYLYWTLHKGCLAWASETKAMLALPGFEPKIDRQSVADFMNEEQMLGDRTWFENVEVLPAGTVLTWDLGKRSCSKRRYWSWSDLDPLRGHVDEDEIAEELGHLFLRGVARCCPKADRVGLMISGGLDSRAVLAAMPDKDLPVHAFTFGREGCLDAALASRVCSIKGVDHHLAPMDAETWFDSRAAGVWWTDGHMSLLHMHQIHALPLMRPLFDVCLAGYLGDCLLGGDSLEHGDDVPSRLDLRYRRFTSLNRQLNQVLLEVRNPFLDRDLVELALRVPNDLKRGHRLYAKVLLKFFPEYYRSIPWHKTRVPIGYPPWKTRAARFLKRTERQLLAALGYLGFRSEDTHAYADYQGWLRVEPARSLVASILASPAAIYPEYLPKEEVLGEWDRHLSGDRREYRISEYVTLEIWLQQVFAGRHRPERL